MFYGTNGPYWLDDGDGVLQESEKNPNAIGFQITNASFGMSLMTPVLPTGEAISGVPKYLGLKASADSVGFVNIDAFELEATNVVVELNLAVGGGADSLTPVVNFEGMTTEVVTLFGPGAIGQGVTVGDLRTLSGQASYSSSIGDLYVIGAADTDVIIGEEATFLANAGLAASANVDSDDRIDLPAEIYTGSSYIYLDEPARRIFASADNVLVNVAEFLYVEGSVAIDLGSRELVTINTGIPGSVGSEFSSFVSQVNGLLDGLGGTLDQLQVTINTELNNALDTLKTTMNDVVDNVVVIIKENIVAGAEAAKNAVNSATSSALDAETAGISATIVGEIEAKIIDPIAGLLGDGAIASLLEALLDPVKKLLSKTLDSVLGDAMTNIVNRLGSTVTGALDSAAGAASDQVDQIIRDTIQPQLNRIIAQLEGLKLQLQPDIYEAEGPR
jgi:hypothetical protein